MSCPASDTRITASAGANAKAYLSAAQKINCGARHNSLAKGKILVVANRKSTWLSAKPFRKKVSRTKRKTATMTATQRRESAARRKSSRQPASQQQAKRPPINFAKENSKK